jgi:peptide/nickel transport system permease protein
MNDQTGGPVPRRSGAIAAFLRDPQGLVGLALLAALLLLALVAGVLYPGDPLDSAAQPLIPPLHDLAHLLGTDSLGRDVAAGIAHGARTSLAIGIVSAAVSMAIGLLVGGAGGYFGGALDAGLVRLTEIFQTTPAFLLLVVILAIERPTIGVISAAIGGISWPMIARLVRAEFRLLRESDFVQAALSLGFGDARIILREILPNALPSIIVTASVSVATAILLESALSFLGLGDANRVSWGSMIADGRELLRTAWYLTALPGAALVVSVMSLNLIGDALNDALNPRLRSAAE